MAAGDVAIPNLTPAPLTATTGIPIGGSTSISGPLAITTGDVGYRIGKVSHDTLQQTRVSVTGGGGATTLYAMNGNDNYRFVLHGDDGTNGYIDVVVVGNYGAGPTPVVVSSSTTRGTPTARTYTAATNNFKVSHPAGGTYTIAGHITHFLA